MLNKVTLCNFRKHRSAEFNFTLGLNVIRGANEAAKTTILEAVGYAFWGAKALRETLAETVTWEQPESTLKVVVVLTLDGMEYTISRSKSGAELLYSDKSVTGQAAVTSFVENLLQCKADIASKLLFASQTSIRGILQEGATATAGLVEALSDLGLIESYVDRIQAQLPSGHTGAVDAQVALLESKVVEIPAVPSDALVTAEKQNFLLASQKFDLSEQATVDDQEYANAVARVSAFNADKAVLLRFEDEKAKIVSKLALPVTVSPYTEEMVSEAKAAVANEAENQRRLRAYQAKFPICEHSWDESLEAYVAAKAKAKARMDELNVERQNLKLELNTATVLKINEDTCAFCKKDLTDVPEVAAINLASDKKIEGILLQLEALDTEGLELVDELVAYKAIDANTIAVTSLAGNYWRLSDTIPPTASWVGEPPVAASAAPDIKAMEASLKAVASDQLARAELNRRLLDVPVTSGIADVTAEKALIEKAVGLKEAVALASIAKLEAKSALDRATAELANQQAAYLKATKDSAEHSAQLAGLKQTQADMAKHNALIKKLRAIRPQIATQLWTTVLGATSHYFSLIRGEASVVTREVDSFKVNGKGTAGLSGSTLDALGLAIRMSLSKLFLPGVTGLFLDESFAGADDTRELAGVGTLASAGFGQVILITHSSLPEALADNLIQL